VVALIALSLSAPRFPSFLNRGCGHNLDGIAVSGLEKSFRSVVALRRVDLVVGVGEIVALLGPNGAGKSTLLRILATSVLPDKGRATVAGYDVVAEPRAVRRSIGVVTGDERAWYWRLTGRQNLEFFSCLNGFRRRAAAARADELLGEMGLTTAADRRVGEYSSGMRARLALARALISNPKILLLDEPTQNLDPAATVAFRKMVSDLARDRGVATLLATHDLYEAAELATRVEGLAEGRIMFTKDGQLSPAELEQEILSATPSLNLSIS
jgi:ABC-2 type transport system ATP-binding protein